MNASAPPDNAPPPVLPPPTYQDTSLTGAAPVASGGLDAGVARELAAFPDPAIQHEANRQQSQPSPESIGYVSVLAYLL